MRKIVHISDLHFGTEQPRVAEALLEKIYSIAPDVVAVSGDLTMRAKSREYESARDYLERIDFPKIIIPGNHDIPLYNIYDRFINPLHRFQAFITRDPFPTYADDELVVLGVNSARSAVFKGGRISREQMEMVKRIVCDERSTHSTVIVIHHNLLPSPHRNGESLLGRSREFLDKIDLCGVDLILTGHQHVAYSRTVNKKKGAHSSTILAAAGSALSDRLRGEPNSFNYLEVSAKNIELNVMEFIDNKFRLGRRELFAKRGEKWTRDE